MINKTIFIKAVLACLLFSAALSGCSWMKSTWRTTKETINPDPEIDLNSYQFNDPSERKLAYLFTPVDAQLTKLVRFVEAQEAQPAQDWFELLMLRFPWLAGAAAVNESAELLDRYPPDQERPLNVDPLVHSEDDWRGVGVQAHIDYTDLGPLLFVAMPYFENTLWKGLTVAYFDPRALLNQCPEPEELIIVHPGNAVWSLAAVDEEAILGLDWLDILDDDVTGEVEIGSQSYTWFARYVGELQIIYMAKTVTDEEAESGTWFFGLF